MEDKNGAGGDIAVPEYLWWAAASAAQFAWAICAYRKGYAGDSRLMPFKAFAVASLFVGSSASAALASLRAFGVLSVDDLKGVGANMRNGLGIPSRTRDK